MGRWNTGFLNTGSYNTGNCNTGSCNTGNWNTGSCNTGNRNTGNWNTGNCNTGFLNTITPKILVFNKEIDIDIADIKFPDYFKFSLVKWISSRYMSEEEKDKYPQHKISDGFLKEYNYKEAWINSFNNTTVADVRLTLNIPNFDYAIFEEISGITKNMIDKKLN